MSFWTRVLNLIVGSGIGAASPALQPAAASLQENQVYQCALVLATMVEGERQIGPVFNEGGLVFTSIDAQDDRRILIISAGAGLFSVPLTRLGVNRLRFQLPSAESKKPRTYYLSYSHESGTRSRYFEFSNSAPPAGHDEMEYALEQPARAEHLLPHLEYALYETSEAALNAITDGRVGREQMRKTKLSECDKVGGRSQALVRKIKRNVDVLEMIVLGPEPRGLHQRMPASVVSRFTLK